ncbi:hypothetical protein [Rhodococcus opacus]|nr:hypothetical protein [Rhodococcus opacus]
MLTRKPAPAGVMPKRLTTPETATPRIAFAAALAPGVINPSIFIVLSGMAIISSSNDHAWVARHNRALGVAVFFGFGTLFALRGLLALV